ncbi:hypothetical protein NC651_017757 [Populus alba x Populus x berolinensis]|nr:hypothetical protein NC651_017757 [Populus alba x Populus x berolinensis]
MCLFWVKKISETNEKRIQPKKKKETKEEKTTGADRKWFFTIETCNSTLEAKKNHKAQLQEGKKKKGIDRVECKMTVAERDRPWAQGLTELQQL